MTLPTMAVFVALSSYFNWTAFVLAVAMNLKLAHLIKTVPLDSLGMYGMLMYEKLANLLLFSFLHAFIQPIISDEKYMVYVFAAKNYLNLSKTAIRILLAIYGVSYCMSLVICGVTFIYRYHTIKNGYAKIFTARLSMAKWFGLTIAIGLYWGFCIFFLAPETPYVDSVIDSPLLSEYGIHLENVTYVAVVYVVKDDVTGCEDWNPRGVFVGFSFVLIIGGVMATCAKCFRRISVDAMPQNKLWKKMFYVQCGQMAIPFSFICIPIMGVLIFPFLELNGDVTFSVSSILVSIYPFVDPIVLMLSISQYRAALCKPREQIVSTQHIPLYTIHM